jgi:RimJ/RimL family protein N-acetyltransferase
MVTERLVIRRFRASDLAAFVAYRSDPEVAKYQGWTAPIPRRRAAELVKEFRTGDPGEPGWFQYAVEHREERVLIGDVGVNLHANLMQAEIGFTLSAQWQGRGLAFEAVQRILHRLFIEAHLRRVSAECDARNVRSAHLLEHLGFRREGYRPAYTWIKGEWTDDVLYGLLAEDWPEIPR